MPGRHSREPGSIEQDADVVLPVHREDMYERESPRAGEADIIIAKHRTAKATLLRLRHTDPLGFVHTLPA